MDPSTNLQPKILLKACVASGPHPSSSFAARERSTGIITTARDTDTAGYLYLGCFEDDRDRVFSGKKYVDAHMTTKVKSPEGDLPVHSKASLVPGNTLAINARGAPDLFPGVSLSTRRMALFRCHNQR